MKASAASTTTAAAATAPPRQSQRRRCSALGSSEARPASPKTTSVRNRRRKKLRRSTRGRGVGMGDRQAEGRGERADQPVDRRAFLGRRGQVEAAQPGALLEAALAEDGVDEEAERRLEARDLGREAEDLGAGGERLLALHARADAAFEPLDQRRELAGEGAAVGLLAGREGRAPDLLALGGAEALEARLEALDEVALGDQQIDRQADLEARVELGQALADLAAVGADRGVALGEDLGGDRDDDAVQRLAAAVLLEQVEEAQPLGGVDLGLALLLHVAAGGVDEDGGLGEEPVAVARAADALEVVGEVEGELEPGLAQRRGLARRRRADDHVPGHLAQEAAAAELAALQLGHDLLELRPDRGDALGGGVVRLDLGKGELGDEEPVGAHRPAPGEDDPEEPEEDEAEDEAEARELAGQGARGADGDERAEEPDDRREEREADQAPEPAGGEEGPEEAEHTHLRAASRSGSRRGG